MLRSSLSTLDCKCILVLFPICLERVAKAGIFTNFEIRKLVIYHYEKKKSIRVIANMLKKRLEEEWKQISVDYLKNLISTMPIRLHHIIKYMSGATKYYTSANNSYYF